VRIEHLETRVRSSWSGSGHESQPVAGTVSPVRASTYVRGAIFFSGSPVANSTAPGFREIAAGVEPLPSGWWRFGGS
jgi:hypothetical protein